MLESFSHFLLEPRLKDFFPTLRPRPVERLLFLVEDRVLTTNFLGAPFDLLSLDLIDSDGASSMRLEEISTWVGNTFNR